MATIDLGKIKMVWRGAYNNATAYTIDDAVSLNGTSYICIAATTGNTPPNATYWNVLAQGGTDLGATLSNNQVAIKNNSGNIAGVNIGTAGQVFKVNSGANGYEFGTISSDYVLLSDTSVSNAAHIQVDVFSATYKVYKVFIGGAYASSNGYGTELRMNSSAGTAQTGSNYCGVNDGAYINSSGTLGQQQNGTFNDNKWKISNMSNNSDETSDHEFIFINPYDASQNTSFIGTGGGFEGNHAYVRHNHGVYKSTEQHTGFTFYVTTGNIYAPVVKVYGLK